MKSICRTLIALCLPFLFCSPASAQHSGPYVGAFVGGNLLTASKSSDSQGTFELKFNPGLMGSAVLGWDFEPGNPVGEGRIELEYTHRSNPLDQARFVEGSVKSSGHVAADSLLLNFYGVYRENGFWSPYIGAGAGAARIAASNLQVTGQPLGDGSAFVFAYQAAAGVDFAMTDSLSLDIGYRFFNTTKPDIPEAGGGSLKLEYLNHSAVLGLRWGF
ncbi:outer membrane protein [Geobacter sp. SVR]|uniref:outer membrane protein n=1 Tax=Geobacter sp. SVR TaxID=2495594 RepID=UPI00143F037C|nr:outer membrane beta-barrel protein [Geobacter sp. SVR]BCS52568.1 outer membrane channel protein [Geobacter sp. SVR]GCF83994.1 P44/Msp2 family outer membrane protein [Geobacter sp. SVR]